MGAGLHFSSHKYLASPQGPHEQVDGFWELSTQTVLEGCHSLGLWRLLSTVLSCHLLLGHGGGFVTSQGISTNKNGLVSKAAGTLKASQGTLYVFLHVN